MFHASIDNPTNIRKTDRILVLGVIDGTKPKNTIGLVDPRLFTGENKLHAVMDTQTTLWHLKYDSGVMPQPLKQQFTSFTKLYDHAVDYFAKRNIIIKEVLD